MTILGVLGGGTWMSAQPTRPQPACRHTFDTGGDGAQEGRLLVNPKECVYCGKWIWGWMGGVGVWTCTRCGALCHKCCVPAEVRLPTLRRGAMRAPLGAPAIILRGKKEETTADGDLPDDDSAELPFNTSAEAVQPPLDASHSIPFEFPQRTPLVSDAGGKRSARRAQHPLYGKQIQAVTAHATNTAYPKNTVSGIQAVLHDCIDGRTLMFSVKWSFRNVSRVSGLHSRRYLRRIRDGGRLLKVGAHTQGLVQRLLLGFTYAKAAYGNGRISSFLFGGQAKGFNPSSYMQTALEVLGWDGKSSKKGRMLHWSWLPEPCAHGALAPGYFFAVDHQQRAAVLSVRGTIYPSDIFIDVNGTPRPFLSGTAHTGISHAAERILQDLRPVLVETLLGEASPYASWPLVLAGHSLGGAVASCLALLVKEDPQLQHLTVTGTTFGVPPCLSVSLAKKVRDSDIITVVNGKDVCPRMTLQAWDYLEHELKYPCGLWGCAHVSASVAAALAILLVPPGGGVQEEGGEDSDVLCVPGSPILLHATSLDPEEHQMLPLHSTFPPATPLLYTIAPEALRGIYLSLDMIAAHPWSSYEKMLHTLAESNFPSSSAPLPDKVVFGSQSGS